MPPLPAVSGDSVIRALARLGFEEIRVRGSHHRLRHPDGRSTTVPVHSGRTVARGTLRAILQQCDLTVDEFTKIL